MLTIGSESLSINALTPTTITLANSASSMKGIMTSLRNCDDLPGMIEAACLRIDTPSRWH